MAEICVTLVLALHLLCVNVAAAAPLVCLWCEWREARGHHPAGELGRFLAKSALLLFLVGMAAGLLVGLLVWSPRHAAALGYLQSKVFFGIAELGFSLVLMAIYVPWWKRFPLCSTRHRLGRALLPLLAGTNLLYHFPLLFVVLSNLTLSESVPKEPLDAAGFRQLILDGEIIARVVHFWLASFAVTGGLILWRAWRLMRRGSNDQQAAAMARWGGRLAAVPTMLQFPVGVWIVLELPGAAQKGFMGGSIVATTLFAVSLLAALWLMHQLASVSFGNIKPREVVSAIVSMLTVVVLMTGTLRAARSERSAADAPATTFVLESMSEGSMK